MKKHDKIASFSLFETVVALSILATITVEYVGLQGNIVYFDDYTLKSSQAIYYAKGLMTQVENVYANRPFEELKMESDQFQESDSMKGFRYRIRIREWDFPITNLLGLSSVEEEGSSEETADPMADMIKQAIGDDLLRIATVEVNWDEGVQENSEKITYLLTNEKKLSEGLRRFQNEFRNIKNPPSNDRRNRRNNRGDTSEGATEGASPPPPSEGDLGGSE